MRTLMIVAALLLIPAVAPAQTTIQCLDAEGNLILTQGTPPPGARCAQSSGQRSEREVTGESPHAAPKITRGATEVRSIREFEASAFAKQHKPVRPPKSWPLKVGGTYTSYSYVDFDGDSSCGVAFILKGDAIEEFEVLWYGESNQRPARLTARREAFLKELLASMSSRADANTVVAYVKANQQVRYPEGVGNGPEHSVGGLDVKAGMTGSSLIVVLRF